MSIPPKSTPGLSLDRGRDEIASGVREAVEERTSALSSMQTHGEPRILFIDQSGQIGGAEVCLLPLAVRCMRRSEVLLLSDGPFREQLEEAGVQVSVDMDPRVLAIKKDRFRLAALAALPGISRQVRRIAHRAKSFDIVFLNTQKALILGALGRALHRKPTVWHVHDIVSRDHFSRVHLLFIKWAVAIGIDHVIANSQASADALIALTGLPRSAVPVVHNGVDVARFRGDAAQAKSALAKLRELPGLPSDAFLVGLFGRLTPWKGQHIGLDAIARVTNARLVLVGDALFGEIEYAKGLRVQAEKLGISNRVHFVGFQQDVGSWMRAMDLIVHASIRPEPFGLVIIEAMAAGRPVIATNGGAVREIIRHLQNGWIVEPDDPARLAEAIDSLRRSPELCARLAAQGLTDVGQQFSIDRYLRQMTSAFSDMAWPGSRARRDETLAQSTNRPESGQNKIKPHP